MQTDYKAIKAKIEEWLQAHGVTSQVQFIGDDCPMFCEDKGKLGIGTFPRKTHIHGQPYRLTLSKDFSRPGRADKRVAVVDFWNSYHDAEVKATGRSDSHWYGQTQIAT